MCDDNNFAVTSVDDEDDIVEYHLEGYRVLASLKDTMTNLLKPKIILSTRQQCMLMGVLYRWRKRTDSPIESLPLRGETVLPMDVIPEACVRFVLQLRRTTARGKVWVDWVYIAQSTLPKAGRGLFAARRFRKGDVVGAYWGQAKRSQRSCSATRTFRMRTENNKGIFVDASGLTLRLGMHMINNPSFTPVADQSRYHREANVDIFPDGLVVANRKIEAGKEIFTEYGDKFNA